MQSSQLGWTAFLVAIASLNPTPASAITPETVPPVNGLETRLARLQSVLQTSAQTLPTADSAQQPQQPQDVALGWGNRSGGGGTFVNSRRGGWGDGSGGGFVNVNPWRNGWSDGGGFFNRRWPDGGSFINRW